MTDILSQALLTCASEIEAFLAKTLDEIGAPERLLAGMRHGALGGGKRLRPFLVQQSAALFGVPARETSAAGAAIELIHCYSLVHDDLPDMDNDALRRGRPAVWKAFDPALAILVGDALQTRAFGLLASANAHADPAIRTELIAALALGAGASGMVGGQVLDIEGEKSPLDSDGIFEMQAKKTGALIIAAADMGAILGRAGAEERGELVRFGAAAGLVFQLADDILDVTATSDALGKTAGKDVAQNKSTIVARHGLDTARTILDSAVAEGLAALTIFGARADMLRALLRYFAERRS